MGNLRDFPDPPDAWWESPKLWTWQKVRTTYRFRRCAALKVTEPKWARL